MTFAFFYLVIGDLIIIHQRAIFDFEIIACNPINKTDKTSKKNPSKLKSKNSNTHVNLVTIFTCFLELTDNQSYYSSKILVKDPTISSFLQNKHYSSLSLRGPPQIS